MKYEACSIGELAHSDQEQRRLGAGAHKRQEDGVRSPGEEWAGKGGQCMQTELRRPHTEGRLCSVPGGVGCLPGMGKQ